MQQNPIGEHSGQILSLQTLLIVYQANFSLTPQMNQLKSDFMHESKQLSLFEQCCIIRDIYLCLCVCVYIIQYDPEKPILNLRIML